MSIASEILALIADRNGIRTALVNKGVPSAANHGYDDFAEDIASIPAGGTYQSKSVRYTTNGTRTVNPDSGYDALSSVQVEVDVSGEAPTLQSKSVTPNKNGMTVLPDSGYDGLSQVTVEGDNDLVAGNIKKDVTIFGVTGSYEGTGGHSVLIEVSDEGLVSAECGGVIATHQLDSDDDADFIAENIKKDVTIFGVTGTHEGSAGPLPGSLIVATCSSNIDRVTAIYGGVTAEAYVTGSKAYVVIPYTFIGIVVLTGYSNSVAVTSTEVTISAIDKYTAQLSTSAIIYDTGAWELENHGFEARGRSVTYNYWSAMQLVENAMNFKLSGNAGMQGSGVYANNYHSSGAITPKISTRGYGTLRFTVDSVDADSTLRVGYSTSADIPSYGSSGYLTKATSARAAGTYDVNIAAADTMIWITFEFGGIGNPAIRNANISKIEFV